jgi:DNA-binding transcriptional ArsR family regulator
MRLTYNLMVVDGLVPERVDRVLHALADPTRRDIVRRALRDERSVTELARLYPMSFAAVQKHVAVLERAGLVTKRRRGREQRVSGDPDGLAVARMLLDDLEAVWRARLDRFAAVLAERTQDTTSPDPRDEAITPEEGST